MIDLKSKYKTTVGIECHVQLATKSKLFSGADNDARDKKPNTVVSPIDYALPGMLPVLNKNAINLAIKAGHALNAKISKVSRFDRKHYFYPDLPKGYQISQMYQPIIGRGEVLVPQIDGTEKIVRIHHAHLEEDAGKLTHHSSFSAIDLNRAGTPLIEIVSEPDMHSSLEAKAYVQELYRLMTYAGVTLGDLYHGNMRFDVNISLAPIDSTELGKRAEIKNINSFRGVERAVEYEFKRQSELLEKGQNVVQETRGWDENSQKTFSQRSKEEAQDYRYMPDPDIPPVVITEDQINQVIRSLPKLPNEYRKSWEDIGFDGTVLNAILANQEFAKLLDSVKNKSNDEVAKKVGIWLTMLSNDINSQNNDLIKNLKVDYLIELANLVIKNKLSATAAKEVFNTMLISDDSPLNIAKNKRLFQIVDEDSIMPIINQILQDPLNQNAILDIKSGNHKAVGYLVGQVMKISKGSANPSFAQKLIIMEIEKQ